MKAVDYLQPVVGWMTDARMKNFLTNALENAPRYFMLNPASSSGKYHAKWSNIKGSDDVAGGLARHTLAVCYMINALSEAEGFTTEELDAALIAGALHDLYKYGWPEEKHTRKDHEHIGAVFFKRFCKQFDPDLPYKEEIFTAILFHQGRYAFANPPKKFPEDFDKIGQLVHRADMVASRKDVSFKCIEEECLLG